VQFNAGVAPTQVSGEGVEADGQAEASSEAEEDKAEASAPTSKLSGSGRRKSNS